MWSILGLRHLAVSEPGYVVEHCLLAGTSDGGFDARAMGMEKYRGVVRVRLLPQGGTVRRSGNEIFVNTSTR